MMTTDNVLEDRSTSEIKTETSPLKHNTEKRSFCPSIFNWDNHSGSLKTIVVILFGTTGAITLALLTQIYYGEYQIQPHGSVTSDSYECSLIGLDILKKGGNAVDAAIATAFCLGVTNFHVTGLGGGGYMMLYNHKKRKVVDVVDFNEVVPYSYDSHMLDNKLVDGQVVGVPGFVKGLWDSHEKHGKLPWKELVKPSSDLAKNGFKVSENVISATSHLKSTGYNSNLVQFLKSLRIGENVSIPELGTTLDLIASGGSEAFYNGSIAMDIVYSVKLANGNMSVDDIFQYKTSRGNFLKTKLGDFDIIVPGSSSGGALLLNSMDAIEILDLDEGTDSPAEIILKVSDTLHDTYLLFLQKIKAFTEQPESAASQVSVVDSEENYAIIISGLSTWLGSQILTNSGFILNNALTRGGFNDERRPVSLASPIIAVQNSEVCGRRFIMGSPDVTVAAQVLTSLLIFNKNTSDSIESPRFYVDNVPRHIRVEDLHLPRFNPQSMEALKQLITIERAFPPYISINVIEKIVDSVYSYADSRGGGRPVQFK